MMSGGPIERFTKGWAVRISFSSHPQKAHYYRRDGASRADTLCGQVPFMVASLRGLGDWVKCKKCEAILGKGGR